MDANTIERRFAKIGARAQIDVGDERDARGSIRVNVITDRLGECFTVSSDLRGELTVLDAQPRHRHLLLMARDDQGKHKFLCGHDERHWFVAAVPERAAASTVATAMEALKPLEVRHEQDLRRVKPRRRNRRRNEAFIRQGEWFFIPAPAWVRPNPKLILRNEPLRRGGGKPHIVEELVRDGGETVYVSPRHLNGLSERNYQMLINRKPEQRRLPWTVQRRNPQVLLRGKVRHADHKTILLVGWRQVLMNTETQSAAMRHVAFID